MNARNVARGCAQRRDCKFTCGNTLGKNQSSEYLHSFYFGCNLQSYSMDNAIFRCPYCPWMGSSSSELNKHKTALHKLEREREKMKKQLFHAGHTVGQYAVGQSDAIQ